MATAGTTPETKPEETLQNGLKKVLTLVGGISPFEVVYAVPAIQQIAVEQLGLEGEQPLTFEMREEIDRYLSIILRMHINAHIPGAGGEVYQQIFDSVTVNKKRNDIADYAHNKAKDIIVLAGQHLLQLSNEWIVNKYKLRNFGEEAIYKALENEVFSYFNQGKTPVVATQEVVYQVLVTDRFAEALGNVADYLDKERKNALNRNYLFDFLRPAIAGAAAGAVSGKRAADGAGYDHDAAGNPVEPEKPQDDYGDYDADRDEVAAEQERIKGEQKENDEKAAEAKKDEEEEDKDKAKKEDEEDKNKDPQSKFEENKKKEEGNKEKKEAEGKKAAQDKKASQQAAKNGQNKDRQKTAPKGGIPVAPGPGQQQAGDNDAQQSAQPLPEESSPEDPLDDSDQEATAPQGGISDTYGDESSAQEPDYSPVSLFNNDQNGDGVADNSGTTSSQSQQSGGQQTQSGPSFYDRTGRLIRTPQRVKNIRRAARFAKDPQKAVRTAKRLARYKKFKAAKNIKKAGSAAKALANTAKLAKIGQVSAALVSNLGNPILWIIGISALILMIILAVVFITLPSAANCLDINDETAELINNRFANNPAAQQAFERQFQDCDATGCVTGSNRFLNEECIEDLLANAQNGTIELWSGGAGVVKAQKIDTGTPQIGKVPVSVDIIRDITETAQDAGVNQITLAFTISIHIIETLGIPDPWKASNQISCQGIAQLCPGELGGLSYENWTKGAMRDYNRLNPGFYPNPDTPPTFTTFQNDKILQMRAIEFGLKEKIRNNDTERYPVLRQNSDPYVAGALWLGLGCDINGTCYRYYGEAVERNFGIVTCNSIQSFDDLRDDNQVVFSPRIFDYIGPVKANAQAESEAAQDVSAVTGGDCSAACSTLSTANFTGGLDSSDDRINNEYFTKNEDLPAARQIRLAEKKFFILHYTATTVDYPSLNLPARNIQEQGQSFEDIIKSNPGTLPGGFAHYMLGQDGTIYPLISEEFTVSGVFSPQSRIFLGGEYNPETGRVEGASRFANPNQYSVQAEPHYTANRGDPAQPQIIRSLGAVIANSGIGPEGIFTHAHTQPFSRQDGFDYITPEGQPTQQLFNLIDAVKANGGSGNWELETRELVDIIVEQNLLNLVAVADDQTVVEVTSAERAEADRLKALAQTALENFDGNTDLATLDSSNLGIVCTASGDIRNYSDDFIIPLPGEFFRSDYGPRNGKFHYGIDIASTPTAPFTGNDILASAAGVVDVVYHDCPLQGTFNSVCGAARLGGFGNIVVLKHNIGGVEYETRYAHCTTEQSVVENQRVLQGQKVCTEGTSGSSTGVHLHFEIIREGQNVNPCTLIRCPVEQGFFGQNTPLGENDEEDEN